MVAKQVAGEQLESKAVRGGAKRRLTRISAGESAVMRVLWNEQPLTAAEIHAAIGDGHNWQLSTVKTLLNRLRRKRAITAQEVGRRFLYSPVLSCDDWVEEECDSVVRRLFGGNKASLFSILIRKKCLPEGDLKELRKIVQALCKDKI